MQSQGSAIIDIFKISINEVWTAGWDYIICVYLMYMYLLPLTCILFFVSLVSEGNFITS